MERNTAAGETEVWVDPDDAPELTDEWFDKAEAFQGNDFVRRGRPPSGNAKEAISIRLDQNVLAALRLSGPGWQSRINDTLRKAMGL